MTRRPDSPVPGRHRARLDWQAQTTGLLLGAAGGMSVNLLSDDVGYRGAAAAATGGAVLVVTSWLRRLPPSAPLVRYSLRLLLVGALIAAVGAGIGPARWAPWAITAAMVATVAAVLVPTDLAASAQLLAGAAFVGAGLVGLDGGREMLGEGYPVEATANVVGGLSLAAFGVAVLVRNNAVFGVAFSGLGVALLLLGVAGIRAGKQVAGTALVTAGGALAGLGMVLALTGGNRLFAAAFLAVGIAVIAVGVIAFLAYSEFAMGAGYAVIGTACVCIGISVLMGNRLLFVTACIGGGLTFAAMAVVVPGASAFARIVITAIGVAAISLGAAHLADHDAGLRIQGWWRRVTASS